MNNVEELKRQCTILGLKPHHRAGADNIKAMIGSYLVEHPEKAKLLYEDPEETPVQQPIDENARAYTKSEVDEMLQKAHPVTRKSLSALKRIRVTCMNPMKREWQGEILSVGSAKRGTWKKFVPFNGQPYHVPKIIYDMMQERQCTIFESIPNPDGRGGEIRRGKLIKEFNIEDLPPLTQRELDNLAKKQQLAKHGL